MGFFGLLGKKKKTDPPASKPKMAASVHHLPKKRQEMSDEQAQRLAQALSHYLKDTK